MGQQQIEIKPISGALGAEIHGVDLAAELDNSTTATVRQAFFYHDVVFVMDHDLTPDQYLAFARRFGGIDVNKFFEAVDGYPEITQVRKEADDTNNIGGAWHTDHSYDAEPALGSMLYAKELPTRGGDTMCIHVCRLRCAFTRHAKDAVRPESDTQRHPRLWSQGPRQQRRAGCAIQAV
jgi:taurine dioxygenase